jgi:hypothetical protein
MISKIAHRINECSRGYNIGHLQETRKLLKGLSRRPGSEIFTDASISDEWAFHYGGRKELQFNIGYEDDCLRYGIAFSLEASQTLPNISLLFPKVLRLNQFIRENPRFFGEYQMWHYHSGARSSIGPVAEISANLLVPNTFIFIGKLIQENALDYPEILATFDELLTPYIYVEDERQIELVEFTPNTARPGFIFEPKERSLPQSRAYTLEEKSVNLEVRHSLIQDKLIQALVDTWGVEPVSAEQNIFGKKIDVVVKRNGEYDFYEIKTCGSAKACVREAFGQLLEYAYWPSCENAKNLVIVGEQRIDNQTAKYLEYLVARFQIPVRYEQVII